MTILKEIKGRDVFAFATEVGIPNAQGEIVMGQFIGSYTLDNPPGILGMGTSVKNANGKTRTFAHSDEAVIAAFQAAENALP